jgi:hypothetical protein
MWVHDKQGAAGFLTSILGLPEATRFGPFLVVSLDNDVSIDLYQKDADDRISLQHYAFLMTEEEFDEVFGRVRERKLEYWADPGRTRPGEVYSHNGGRGIYFMSPDGHLLEIMTRPYSNDSLKTARR